MDLPRTCLVTTTEREFRRLTHVTGAVVVRSGPSRAQSTYEFPGPALTNLQEVSMVLPIIRSENSHLLMPLTRLMPGARNLRFLRLTLPYRILDLGLDTIHRFTHAHMLPLPETPLNFDSLVELAIDFAENHVCSPFLFTLLRLTPRLKRLKLMGHLSFETYRPHYEQQGPANHANETWPEPACSLRWFRCGHYLRPKAICMILRASRDTIEDLALEVNTAVCRMIVETVPALPRLRHLAFGWALNSRRPDLAPLLRLCDHITQLSVHITTNGNECLEIAQLLDGAGIHLQVLYLYGRAITTTTWAAGRLSEMIEETAALRTLRRFILCCGVWRPGSYEELERVCANRRVELVVLNQTLPRGRYETVLPNLDGLLGC